MGLEMTSSEGFRITVLYRKRISWMRVRIAHNAAVFSYRGVNIRCDDCFTAMILRALQGHCSAIDNPMDIPHGQDESEPKLNDDQG